MDSTANARIPEIYILWHPRCAIGQPLARRMLRWLRPGHGFGPDVFFRSLPAPGSAPGSLPAPLPHERRGRVALPASRVVESSRFKGSDDNRQIVFALVDEQLVADYAWRSWLDSLVEADTAHRLVLPVALSPYAYNLPDRLRALNFLRPSGLPLTGPWQDGNRACEDVARTLLKQVTDVLCRELLPRPAHALPGAVPKVNVFLSHAKADGVKPAQRLRDYIYSQTQLSAFFDENDIAFGGAFASVIEGSVKNGETAALVAVRSARYSSRPWCRREFSLFRSPVEAKPRNWRVFPALVVEAMDGHELATGVPEMGNCPIIHWNEADDTLEELVITTLIRDAMLASYHATLAESFELADDELVINWLPDPTTLLHLAPIREQQPCTVYYPGAGIPGQELDVLERFFPKATFTAFEQRQ